MITLFFKALPKALSTVLDIGVCLLALFALVLIAANGRFGFDTPTDRELLRFAAGGGVTSMLILALRHRQ